MSATAPTFDAARRLRVRRRVLLALLPFEVVALALLARSHRGVHVVQNLVLPGSGLYENHAWLGASLTAAAVVAVIGWLWWGTDWAVAAVWLVAVVATIAWAPSGHGAATALAAHGAPSPAAHEFPVVALLVGALTWLRSAVAGLPVVQRWRAGRARRTGVLDPVSTAHAAALGALASSSAVAVDERAVQRARRVALMARGRRRDPLALDQAGVRAALVLGGAASATGADALVADAGRRVAGVPASEPGWVRPLDATLAAIALQRTGATDAVERWRACLTGPLSLHRGHRPAWYWTPLGLSAGKAPLWEHVAMSALNRTMGWIDDADWHARRREILGAAARGAGHPLDERTIAAARLWLVHVDDAEAARIVARPTVARDPVAVALDRLAASLAAGGQLVTG